MGDVPSSAPRRRLCRCWLCHRRRLRPPPPPKRRSLHLGRSQGGLHDRGWRWAPSPCGPAICMQMRGGHTRPACTAYGAWKSGRSSPPGEARSPHIHESTISPRPEKRDSCDKFSSACGHGGRSSFGSSPRRSRPGGGWLLTAARSHKSRLRETGRGSYPDQRERTAPTACQKPADFETPCGRTPPPHNHRDGRLVVEPMSMDCSTAPR